MSDPPSADIDFKNKMVWVWTTLKSDIFKVGCPLGRPNWVVRTRASDDDFMIKSPSFFSFSGCGFLGIYHVGVGACLKEHCPV